MDKGQKPNETQESRVEEKRNITTVVNNSSNIGEEGRLLLLLFELRIR